MKTPKTNTVICRKNVYQDGNKKRRTFTNGRSYWVTKERSQLDRRETTFSTVDDQGEIHSIGKPGIKFFDQHFWIPARAKHTVDW